MSPVASYVYHVSYGFIVLSYRYSQTYVYERQYEHTRVYFHRILSKECWRNVITKQQGYIIKILLFA